MRKGHVKSYLFSLVALASFAGVVAPSAAQAWELTCRGGGTANWVTFSSWDGGNSLVFAFARGGAPASEELYPGYCAWPDREMWSNEPAQICFGRSINDINITILPKKASAQTPDAEGAAIRAIFSMVNDPDSYYTFNVENNGRGCMTMLR